MAKKSAFPNYATQAPPHVPCSECGDTGEVIHYDKEKKEWVTIPCPKCNK